MSSLKKHGGQIHDACTGNIFPDKLYTSTFRGFGGTLGTLGWLPDAPPLTIWNPRVPVLPPFPVLPPLPVLLPLPVLPPIGAVVVGGPRGRELARMRAANRANS